MKRIALVLFILLYSLAASGVRSEDNEARQILDRLYKPSGQMPIKDMVLELDENTVSGGSSSLVASGKDKIYFKAPHKIRVDSLVFDPEGALDRKTMIIIRDGKMAWQYLSTGQYPVKKKQDEPSAPLNIPFGIVQYPQDLEKQYAFMGAEVVDGVNTSVVKITSSAGEEVTVCIDNVRCIPLKMILKKKDDKGKDIVKKVLYKQIGKAKDGRYFPYKLEIYKNDAVERVVVYTAVTFNVGLDEGLFMPMEKFVK